MASVRVSQKHKQTIPHIELGRNSVLDPRAEPRDPAILQELVDHLKEGGQLPPVQAVRDDAGTFWVYDGYYRLGAAEQAGHDLVEVEYFEGSIEDAVAASAAANVANNTARRTNADKRLAVRKMLDHPIWRNKSGRAIADHCGVSHRLVDEVRRQVATVATSLGTDPNVRVTFTPPVTGRDGKHYPATRDTGGTAKSKHEQAVGGHRVTNEGSQVATGGAGPLGRLREAISDVLSLERVAQRELPRVQDYQERRQLKDELLRAAAALKELADFIEVGDE